MYCPKCGTENIPQANFCRACGVRLQRVSRLASPTTPSNATAPDLSRAIKKLVVGIGLLLIAFVPLLEGEPILWWLLFPGLPMVIKGIRLLTQIKEVSHTHNRYEVASISHPTTPIAARPSRDDMRARPTGELVPPSVTENTTRLLD